MLYANRIAERYSPLYFLAALGAGGLAVSFFMYLMWLTPHAGSPIPTFATLSAAWADGDAATRAIIAVGAAGVALFAAFHVRLLIWNWREYLAWSRTPAYAQLRAGNAETQLLAIPLTMAMTINVGFIVGAVFVPGLWGVREWLFPLALAGFAALGVWAVRIFLDFIARVFTEGGFDCAKNNSLGQMMVVFAFSMIGVGFSAAAAMSHIQPVVIIGFFGATLFVTAAILLGMIKLVLGFRAMMEHAAAEETTPTLWIIIPIVTVLAIAIYRLNMSLAHSFNVPWAPGEIFAFLTTALAIQIVFGMIGWAVMRRVGYFEKYVSGPKRSPGAYALICPGVALVVSANFFVNAGLVKLGAVAPFSPAHIALYVPIVVLQLITIRVFFQLNGKLLTPTRDATSTPAAPLQPAE